MSKLPNIPDSLVNDEAASLLIAIWKNVQRNCPQTYARSGEDIPRTVLAVAFSKMINMTPQDVPHPLYCPEFSALTEEFVLDHLSAAAFELNSANEDSKKQIIKTLSNKYLVFTRNEETGHICVNGIGVKSIKQLSGGITVIVIDNFLFDHYEQTQAAFRKLMSSYEGKCLGSVCK